MDHAADAPPVAERAGDGELPTDVLLLVLLPLKGDVASLCAAACVARAWRQAAYSPRLWTRIGRFRGNAAKNLTDARLRQLVFRARHHLYHLDLRGRSMAESSLTDTGLAVALRREKRILSFYADGDPLTGAGIAVALAPSSGVLRTLRVCGVRALPRSEATGAMSITQQEAFTAACVDSVVELQALLVPGAGSLNATAVCDAAMSGNVLCTRMCDDKNVCGCESVFCKRHADCVFECVGCWRTVCGCCTSLADDICDECFLDGSGSGSDYE
jgi:hypothetical protein